jgi:hypothetical protein
MDHPLHRRVTVSDGGRTVTFLNGSHPILSAGAQGSGTPTAIVIANSSSSPTDGTWFKQVTDSYIQTGNVTSFANMTAGSSQPLDWEWFRRTGHNLIAWAFGAIGGMIARAWWRGPRRHRGWDRLGAT